MLEDSDDNICIFLSFAYRYHSQYLTYNHGTASYNYDRVVDLVCSCRLYRHTLFLLTPS